MLITISDILARSWKTYTTHWKQLTVYMFFIFLPALVRTASGLIGNYFDDVFPSSALISNIIIAVIFILGLIFSLWAALSLTQAAKELVVGVQPRDWKFHFNSTLHLLWPIILASILVGLIVVGGTLLFIIPGVIFAVWYAFVSQAIVLDNHRGTAALAYSKQLVAGRWWDIFLRLLVPGLVFVGITIVARALILWPLGFVLGATVLEAILQTVVYAAVDAVVTPLSVLATVLLYLSAQATPVLDIPQTTPPKA